MKHVDKVFFYGQNKLSIGIALQLSRGQLKGALNERSLEKIKASRKQVEYIVEKGAGINSAFMMLQYTTAALASENKGL